MLTELERAVWVGDLDRLQELAPCACCCAEHTFPYCPARLWGGCRSGRGYGDDWRQEEQEWQRFYERERGMTAEEFYGVKP